MRNIVKVICLALTVFVALVILTGCKSKTIYVPVEHVKTEYINKYMRDSIHYYDSIYIKEKGDSILVTKYKYIYHDRFRTDTIMKTDSVQIPFPVIEYKEVNRLSGWQNFQLYAFRILLGLIIAYFGIRYRKVIFGFFKRLIGL